MDASIRANMVFCVWLATAIAAGFSFAGNAETTINDLLLALIFAFAAIVGTVIVMRLNIAQPEQSDESTERGKRKRSDTPITRMIDEMDERELAVLRRRLSELDRVEAPPTSNVVRQEQKR